MNRAVAALTAAFVVGSLAFVAAVVHVAWTGEVGGIDIVGAGAACLLAGATVALISRQRPRINGVTTAAQIYAEELQQVSADR
ncbi:hypothetical protein [Nonomuraea gerenzanensis]|uniref:hypothetical protein n=1 Tax=Nonomuraea gerenzanensis TaxID=93944 RepID=UPI001CD9DD03|nr:hypothetical protein [Nonomuraea gerenzanensis]UBU16621.1 hypothetical protein LCN96_16870 [Nonomuraea gerenzanensis]